MGLQKAKLFAARMSEYKRYTLSFALLAYLNSVAPVRRNPIHHVDFADSANQSSQNDWDSGPSKAALQPLHKLPSMATNEEGEVFWYIPRQRVPRFQKPGRVGPREGSNTGSFAASNSWVGPAGAPGLSPRQLVATVSSQLQPAAPAM